MIVFLASFGGAIWGALLAKRRRGNRIDMAQYAVSSAITFGLLGMFCSIVLARVLG